MRVTRALFWVAITALPLFAQQQDAPTWKQEQKTEAFRGTSYTQFTLQGKFLTQPQQSPLPNPEMVVQCIAGEDHRGHTKGKFITGYVVTGAVLDTAIDSKGNSAIGVQFRLDDGKIHSVNWGHSKNFSAIFFYMPSLGLFAGSGYEQFANLLYGHEMYHKEKTSPQVRKILVDVPEYLGGEIVMQFDLPDSTNVADACGIIWHK
jgi:hypothetical protein